MHRARPRYPAAMTNVPAWERRFRAPVLSFPSWAPAAPDRLVVASTESGSYQLHAWDRAGGTRRQVTDDPVGVISGRPTPDGDGVVWFRDETGDETGAWVVAPFDSAGEPRPLLPGLPRGWAEGLALGRTRAVAGLSTPDGFEIWVADAGSEPRRVHRHAQPVGVAAGDDAGSGGLSADERFVCLSVAEDGDLFHPWLRVLDCATGVTVAEVRDAGRELTAFGWSPVPGDERLAITHERRGERRPATWDTRTGEVRELPLELEGTVQPAGWWPDASALLLLQMIEGRNHLYRLDLESGRTTRLETQPGSITAAGVRPDGSIWYRVHAGTHPARLLAVGSPTPLLVADGPLAPDGRPFETWHFTNPHGQRVHGFLVRPDGPGPHPVMFRVHGGPTSVDMDRWAPDLLSHADAGFLVAMVNYRGSEGFGAAWRDALTGNVGFAELEDIGAGFEDLVARGLADPTRAVLAGWSWGGYVTLLGIGREPARWTAAVAGVPVADYVAAYEDESPILQAMDRALLGGTPDEVPDLIRERSPITYLDQVRTPTLILAGEHDSRCPIRQVKNYMDRAWERGFGPELYTYATGHASFNVGERVRQNAIVLDFLARHVPGVRRLDGIEAHLPEPAAQA